MAKSKKYNNSDKEVTRFVKLDRNLTQSTIYKMLSGSESKIFHALLSKYNGRNNGNLAIPYNQANSYALSRQTLSTGLKLLEAKGLIKCTRQGYSGAISLYAVTCYAIDECFNGNGAKVHSVNATDRPSNEWGKYDKWLKERIAANGGQTDKKFLKAVDEELLKGFSKI